MGVVKCCFSNSIFFIACNLGFGSNFLFSMHGIRNVSDLCGAWISKALDGTECWHWKMIRSLQRALKHILLMFPNQVLQCNLSFWSMNNFPGLFFWYNNFTVSLFFFFPLGDPFKSPLEFLGRKNSVWLFVLHQPT